MKGRSEWMSGILWAEHYDHMGELNEFRIVFNREMFSDEFCRGNMDYWIHRYGYFRAPSAILREMK